MWRIRLVTVLAVVFLFARPASAAAPTVDGVAEQLICQCGCTMVLNNCSHAECASRETMLGIIKQRIAQGESEEQIVQAFVSQFGESVLAEPPKKGFNLTAWLSPFAAIAAGAVIIYLAIKKWLKRGEYALQADAGGGERDDEYLLRIEQDLKEFPEKGFR